MTQRLEWLTFERRDSCRLVTLSPYRCCPHYRWKRSSEAARLHARMHLTTERLWIWCLYIWCCSLVMHYTELGLFSIIVCDSLTVLCTSGKLFVFLAECNIRSCDIRFYDRSALSLCKPLIVSWYIPDIFLSHVLIAVWKLLWLDWRECQMAARVVHSRVNTSKCSKCSMRHARFTSSPLHLFTSSPLHLFTSHLFTSSPLHRGHHDA